MTALNPWLAFRRPRPEARVRLICFPFAGGGASIYRTWPDALPASIEVCPVQLPGRESRLRETAHTSMTPLVDGVLEALAPLVDDGVPTVLFGHSMGGIIAFETARRLEQLHPPGAPQRPRQLIVSARRAPHLPPLRGTLHTLPDDQLRNRLRELNGTPEAVLEHPELMELMLPLLRADFELNDTFRPAPAPALDLPLTAYGGTQDPDVARADLDAWLPYTRGPGAVEMIEGDHFYLLHAARDVLLAKLVAQLRAHEAP